MGTAAPAASHQTPSASCRGTGMRSPGFSKFPETSDRLAIALEGDIQVLPVDRPIAIKASQLPEHHRDPADRIIIATALIHEASLVSLDSVFPQYEELKDRLITG
ncbi:PIN domain-containing protein [Limnospira fusiformis]|uniref:PIN domain-containing protein n=1 Tax=Limnospira fusiformis TaxID=54297 RepID=UPI0034E0C523